MIRQAGTVTRSVQALEPRSGHHACWPALTVTMSGLRVGMASMACVLWAPPPGVQQPRCPQHHVGCGLGWRRRKQGGNGRPWLLWRRWKMQRAALICVHEHSHLCTTVRPRPGVRRRWPSLRPLLCPRLWLQIEPRQDWVRCWAAPPRALCLGSARHGHVAATAAVAAKAEACHILLMRASTASLGG